MLKKTILYFLFVLLFVVGKFVFLCYYSDIFGDYPMSDWMSVLWHGLPHDLTCAGYIMALPFLVELWYIWYKGEWHRAFMCFWLRLVLLLVVVDFLCDLFLYGYWGFRLDQTALTYFLDSPWKCLGQAPLWMLCAAPVLSAGYCLSPSAVACRPLR